MCTRNEEFVVNVIHIIKVTALTKFKISRNDDTLLT